MKIDESKKNVTDETEDFNLHSLHHDEDESGHGGHHHHHDDDEDDDDDGESCGCGHHHHHDDDDDDEGCGCHHHHGHSHGDDDDEEEEHSLPRIIVAAVLFVFGLLLEKLPVFALNGPVANGNPTIHLVIRIVFLALYFASYVLTGLGVIKEAVEGLLHGSVFNEEFLMAVATLGAIVMGEYSEAVAVMILFQLGEFLEDVAVDRSRRSITKLMDIRPDKANLKKDGGVVEVMARDVNVGDVIVVKPGERVPLDGVVVSGTTMVDTSALTGESVPREILTGDEILSGFVNNGGVIEVEVKKVFGQSTVSRVLRLVENAQSKKARTQKFISRVAKYYTPAVCLVALLVAVIPPLVTMAMGVYAGGIWKVWIYRALEILVVSCPCALVISVPLSFFAGIGLASEKGILVKGSNYLEMLAHTTTAVFDKTGTLTKGVFEVTDVHLADPSKMDRETLIALATHAEYYSNHPISRSLKKVHHCAECEHLIVENTEEVSGHGVKCVVNGKMILAGNMRLMQKENVKGYVECHEDDTGTVIHVACDGEYMGHIIISDIEKNDACETVSLLKKAGITKTVMLTGDSQSAAEKVAKKLGVDEVYAQLLPADKVSKLEDLIEQNSGTNRHLAFVGDGINDAPVLSRADVGIAMGGMGSDAAIEAADVVIMDDMPSRVATAVNVGKKTMRTVWQNVIFALGVKTLIMVICATGLGNMWMAVFGDVGVTMLAVLNAMRLLWFNKNK